MEGWSFLWDVEELTILMIFRQRHLFLSEIGLNQYDPLLPAYVSLDMLADTADQQFCDTVANCKLDLYYKFLKTL